MALKDLWLKHWHLGEFFVYVVCCVWLQAGCLHFAADFDSFACVCILQCSYHRCSRIVEDNSQAVLQFAQKYDLSSSPFPCYYDPNNSTFAVVEIVHLSTTANAIIWPALALMVGLIVFFVQVSFKPSYDYIACILIMVICCAGNCNIAIQIFIL